MITVLQILIGLCLTGFAIMAVTASKVINAVIYLSLLSLSAAVAFLLLKAPDVAITEAVIGSGLVTALFIFTLLSERKLAAKGEDAQ